MRRRDFIGLVSGVAATLPFAARAQQFPVIGFLNGGVRIEATLEEFRRGIGEAGYIEGQNVTIDYRWAEGDYSRLPSFAAELVNRKVAIIASGGGDLAARAAKGATSAIPVVLK